MIHINKIDETLLKVTSDDSGVLMEISEHYTFFAQGYQYMPAFKNRSWDGRIRIFNARNSTLPYGLLMNLLKFANNRGYKVVCDDSLKNDSQPSVEDIKKFIGELNITNGKGEKITPYDYQIGAAIIAISERRQLIISPTGSGKSLIIYLILRWYLEHDHRGAPAVVVVPTTGLVEQLQGDFTDYSLNDISFDASKIQKIYSGKDKSDLNAQIIMTTWQSAINMPKKWFHQFGCLIGDEAHLFRATSLNSICNNLVNADYRIGTTGTLDGTVCNELILNGNFGPTIKVKTTAELMDEKTLAQLDIKCLILKYEDELRKVICKMDYANEIDAIVTLEKRNKFIANLALGLPGNTLVLFKLVGKHGKPLTKLITQQNNDKSRPIFYVAGDIPTDERELIRKTTEEYTCTTTLHFGDKIVKIPNSKSVELQSGEKKLAKDLSPGDCIKDVDLELTGVDVGKSGVIISASLGTFSTGINIKNVHNIIFACPIKGQIKVLQSIGRILRLADNGSHSTVYDICDDFSWKKKTNFAMKHAMIRCKIYDKEKFKYKIKEINL